MFDGFSPEKEARPLIEYWHVVRRHKWAIISITIISTIVGILIAASIKPSYLASARLLVEPDNRQLLSSSDINNNVINSSSFYRTQVELIRSQSLAKQIINELHLTSHVDYLPTEPGFIKQFLNTNEKGMPLKTNKTSFKDVDELIPIFNERLRARPGKNSDIIHIHYESGDPVMAAKIVNAVTKEYMNRVELAQKKYSEQTIEWLAENLEEARKKLVDAEAKLQAYQSEARMGDSEEEARINSGKLGGITAELLTARTNRAEAEIRYKQVNSLQRSVDVYESIYYVIQNPQVQKLKEKYIKLEQHVEELSTRYGHKHPKLISVKNELKSAKKQVDHEILRVVDSIKKSYELAVAKEQEVNRMYEQVKTESREKKGAQFSLAKLEREVETHRDLYNLLLTRFKEADMSKESGSINIRVLDAAIAPKMPFKPNRIRIVGIAFAIGLFLSVLLSVLREFNDKTFKTGEDIADKIRIPLLGIFPILSKKDLFKSSPERLIVEKPRSSVAEAINNIRTNIIFGNNEEPPQVIMVTSAVASEGKTTVSCNLGIALARLGPTLVIEADTRRPRMRALQHKGGVKGGIFEYIAGKTSLKNSVVVDPQVKNLYTMPVKLKPAKPIEFLSSRRFNKALLVLRKKFKFIVIDTPPILPVSDAIVLAPIVDGTVLVVGAESTKHAMAKDALSRLEQVNAQVLGAVLSRANPKTFGTYGSNYYYGYGYGYSPY